MTDSSTRRVAVRDRKERSHERIVDAAARAIRRDGYAGVGVADVMADAGLTHGGFYAHFPSRDALLVAALERAGRASVALMSERTERARSHGHTPFRAFVESYLHDSLLGATDAGCPVAALCAEMPRQRGDVRAASRASVRSLLRAVARCLPDGASPDAAAAVAGALVGALQIARAIGANAEGRAVLAAARRTLVASYEGG